MLVDPGGLQAYLNANSTYDVYESFSIDGEVFTTRGAGGNPPVRRGSIRASLGTEVATCDFTILCGGGSPYLGMALGGDWDGVPLIVSRVFVRSVGGNLTVVRFNGYVADVRPSSTYIDITGKSLLIELKKKIPGRTFSSLCPYVYNVAPCVSPTAQCDYSVDTCTSATGGVSNFGGFVNIPQDTEL
jgi:hypothetical protein